jgi:hypothetical protein
MRKTIEDILNEINTKVEQDVSKFLSEQERKDLYIHVSNYYDPHFDASIFGNKIDKVSKSMVTMDLTGLPEHSQRNQQILRQHLLDVHNAYVNKIIEDYKIYFNYEKVAVMLMVTPIKPIESIHINLAIN